MDFLNLHPFVRSTAVDKALGAIVGAALGDAIGLFTEFLPKTACHNAYPGARFSLIEPNRTPFREDSHRDKFDPADWTDDTDQSLLIILSYLHNSPSASQDSPVVDAKDIALRIKNWITQGLRCLDRPPLGIGQTIGRVVLDPAYLDEPEGVALRIWLKSNRNAAPNGSLMRTHPLGVMCIGRSLEETFRVAADVGRVTHVDPRCVVSCCLVTGLVRGILRGEVLCENDLDGLIEKAFAWVNGHDHFKHPELKNGDNDWEDIATRPEVEDTRLNLDEYQKHCNAQTFQELQLDDSQKMGYVYKCLGSSILCLRLAMRKELQRLSSTPAVFESIITDLIMEGGDADTNACVAGALLGAWVGYSQLPPHWENGIRNRDWLLKKAHRVNFRAGISLPSNQEGREMVESDPDTALDGGRGMLNKEQLDRRERDFVMMILTKHKERREAEERREKAKRSMGLGKWFK